MSKFVRLLQTIIQTFIYCLYRSGVVHGQLSELGQIWLQKRIFLDILLLPLVELNWRYLIILNWRSLLSQKLNWFSFETPVCDLFFEQCECLLLLLKFFVLFAQFFNQFILLLLSIPGSLFLLFLCNLFLFNPLLLLFLLLSFESLLSFFLLYSFDSFLFFLFLLTIHLLNVRFPFAPLFFCELLHLT